MAGRSLGLANLFLLRVPIAAWASPAVLAALLLTPFGSKMLQALFIVRDPWGSFGVSFFAAILGISAYSVGQALGLRRPLRPPMLFLTAAPWAILGITTGHQTIAEIGLLPNNWINAWLAGLIAAALLTHLTAKARFANTLLAVATLIAYQPLSANPEKTPAFLHLLAGTAFCGWLLSAMAFFLDRHRIPLLAVVIASAIFTGAIIDTDHYFEVRSLKPINLPDANKILSRGPRAIVVAAEGGGVQAAAWTTRVLTGLAEIEGFRENVRLISGVSGGSVGTLYFLRTYPSSGPNALEPADAIRLAAAPNLEPIARGMIQSDLRNLILPLPRNPLIDRGWALEQSLARRAGIEGIWLSQWINPGLPAVVFNATEVETGMPIAFATTRFCETNPILRGYLENDRLDTAVATAVRLSAAFPMISPAARPLGHSGGHIVDGGYYDNSGIYSLLAWLDSAQGNLPPILLIRIVPFPEENQPATTPHRPWIYQFAAPLETLETVRTAAQHYRNRAQLELFLRNRPIQEVVCRFEPPPGCRLPPLSWNLSSSEVACIQRAWQHQSTCIKEVHSFLNQ
jgi:hypothetical protein